MKETIIKTNSTTTIKSQKNRPNNYFYFNKTITESKKNISKFNEIKRILNSYQIRRYQTCKKDMRIYLMKVRGQ